jgi:hypothetical protein
MEAIEPLIDLREADHRPTGELGIGARRGAASAQDTPNFPMSQAYKRFVRWSGPLLGSRLDLV